MKARTVAPILLLSLLLFIVAFTIYVLILATDINWPNKFVYVSSIILAVFLIILILRYLLLIWFSYLSHHEKTHLPLPQRWPKVSVLVPVYNEGKIIDSTVRALLHQDYPDYEILLINDGSQDESYRRLLRYQGDFDGVTIKVIQQVNLGKAQALNAGIRAAGGELVFCMDGDTILKSDALKFMVRHFEDAKVGAVAGNVKVGNRGRLWTDLQAPWPGRRRDFSPRLTSSPAPAVCFASRPWKRWACMKAPPMPRTATLPSNFWFRATA
jgi:cellulose synthase/poly-beta-1,6-N-acetylglucosamine synthase-like glycosyltransferase